MLKQAAKNFVKKYFYGFWLRDKLAVSVQIAQLRQFHYYRDCLRRGSLPAFNDTGFKVFSQFEEDGKLLYIFSLIGMGQKTFVDLGSNDGVNSNCANLAVHFGWRGLFVDGDKTVIGRGRRFYAKYPNPWSYKPKFVQSFITAENVNDIVKPYFSGAIDLLSIDIDGNDYWIWKALEIVRPRVVVIESQVAFAAHDIVTAYDPDFAGNVGESNRYGASTPALCRLANEKGYRLVGSNQYGNNLFFVENGLCENELQAIAPESTLRHPFATEKFIDDAELKTLKSN